MPELPEVETLKRELFQAVVGLKIKSAKVLWPKTVLPLSPLAFSQQIKNKKIRSISRQAKILIINFTDSTTLAIHLKLTGQLIYNQPSKYVRIIFEFTDGSYLYFNDLRKFGWVRLINNEEIKNLIAGIGVEPLSKNFNYQVLADILKRYPNRPVKQILLDQKLIAGLGNIYADESCFRARISPTRRAKTLKPAEIKKLYSAIIAILKLAIKKKGTSTDTYRQLSGRPGGFVPYLKVYARAGQPCKICNYSIKKIKFHSRGTHFCPHCQK